MKRSTVDERQLGLDFSLQVEVFVDAARSMLELKQAPPPHDPDIETEAELYVEIAGACKAAIRESGKSREQILDAINSQFHKVDGDPAGKKPLTINMFNNYLSKPTENRIPVWLLYGIAAVTGSLKPFRPLVAGLGGKIITSVEETELLLGKLEQHIRDGATLKRQLQRELSGRGR
jgi:hypothetical protein